MPTSATARTVDRRRALQSLAALSLGLPWAARAQAAWPTRPVKILISFPPGGSSDFVGRTLAPFLAEQLGQPFVVDNKPGAGGMIAAEALKKEAPDGYTFMISNNAPFSIAPTQFKNVNYDAVKDFTHITYLGSTYGGCVASPKLGARNLADLIAKARANPGKLTFGSSGTGSIGHIFGETFKRMAKVDMLHVPYKGAAPLRQGMLGGEVDAMFESVTGNLAFLKAGTMVALGSASPDRLEPVPDLPTFREQGLDMISENWHGLTAPPGLPPAIANRVHQVLLALLQRKDVLEKLAVYGVFYKPMTGPGFQSYVAAQLDYWRPQIIAAGVAGQ
ncbi:MAG: tripartite tricarboxylate transporter substrate binding protein [Rhodoferax sp.]|nr:tripartite tricarboxylate transporter substrate binding protein [Rhodoferax sp.]